MKMKMRISLPETLGAIIGWFIIAPIVPPYIDRSPLQLIERSILGLIIVISIGLFFGSLKDLHKAEKEHRILMQKHRELINKIEEEIKQLGKTKKSK